MTLTLVLIAAVETDCGKNVTHKVVRNPSSVSFGDTAQGRYALMPNTLKELKTTSELIGAKRYVRLIWRLQGTKCPLTVVRAWEAGAASHRRTLNTARRYRRAQEAFRGIGCFKMNAEQREQILRACMSVYVDLY